MAIFLSAKKSTVLAYGVSVLSCLIAWALTKWIRPFVGLGLFEFFHAAVVLSAWYGGLGPGLLAGTISFLMIDYFFVLPMNAWAMGPHLVRLIIFGFVAVLTSMLSGKLKKSKSELEVAHRELEKRIEERTRQLSISNEKLMQEVAHRSAAEKAILEISNREQRRLGQDLHDGLSQILAGVKFMTEVVRESLEEKTAPEAKRMAVIESQLGNALAYVDTVSRGLYPVELEINGLAEALKELAGKMSKIYPVTCQFKCWSEVTIDAAVANHLYRIAQEAVINAIKGGKGNRINVRLIHRGETTLLSIADNGNGFGNEPVRKGMGLKMMEYRARVIDGSLRIRSRPSGGTLVRCVFPGGNRA